MDIETILPTLLLIAWLLPLASFAVICVGYSVPQMLGIRVRYSTQKYARLHRHRRDCHGCLLSMIALFGIGCRHIRSRPASHQLPRSRPGEHRGRR